MKMNATKSHILTNIHSDDENFPTDNTFNLGGNNIKVKHRHEITRILGVFLSMDNLHAKTREHAIKAIKMSTNIICAKSNPGNLGAFLAKTVLVPTIQ